MHISKVIEEKKTGLSFEFFPPKSSQASQALYQSIEDLVPLRPSFVSVTYGAGGSTRQRTHDLVAKIQSDTNLTVVSHLTCVGHSKLEIETILRQYESSGISNIMALRGDPPQGQKHYEAHPEGLVYASELVSLIKKKFPQMGIGVAGFPEGHPECPNRLKEIEYLKQKVDCGADYICTQLFFDNNEFYDFCERCDLAGIKVPIIAGVMPITSLKGIKRMAELALGAKFPAKLLKSLNRAGDDEYAEKVGVHWATEQVLDLINHEVKGVHFYTLNKSLATRKICQNIGIKNSDGLSGKLISFL